MSSKIYYQIYSLKDNAYCPVRFSNFGIMCTNKLSHVNTMNFKIFNRETNTVQESKNLNSRWLIQKGFNCIPQSNLLYKIGKEDDINLNHGYNNYVIEFIPFEIIYPVNNEALLEPYLIVRAGGYDPTKNAIEKLKDIRLDEIFIYRYSEILLMKNLKLELKNFKRIYEVSLVFPESYYVEGDFEAIIEYTDYSYRSYLHKRYDITIDISVFILFFVLVIIRIKRRLYQIFSAYNLTQSIHRFIGVRNRRLRDDRSRNQAYQIFNLQN